MFSDMLDRIKHEVIGVLSKVQVRAEADVEAVEKQRRSQSQVKYQHEQANAMGEAAEDTGEEAHKPFTREGRKIGRNEPCPCGSGKKYKQCHGKLT
jgi:preprotein translocase subunit SecA